MQTSAAAASEGFGGAGCSLATAFGAACACSVGDAGRAGNALCCDCAGRCAGVLFCFPRWTRSHAWEVMTELWRCAATASQALGTSAMCGSLCVSMHAI